MVGVCYINQTMKKITFNDNIITMVASMLKGKKKFEQTYFANPDFQNYVNARVFQTAVSQLSS